jgi:SAM-dependent methyltransferase
MAPKVIEMSDVYAGSYRDEITAFRAVIHAVAKEIFATHFAPKVQATTLEELCSRSVYPTDTAYHFSSKLLGYFLDTGELTKDGDDRLHMGRAFQECGSSDPALEAYLTGDPRRASTHYFLRACRDLAGEILSGGDTLAILRDREPERIASAWEDMMLAAPFLEPCHILAARTLMGQLSSGRPITVFEGGAGIGTVLRQGMLDELFRRRLSNVSRYWFTELSSQLLAIGRERLSELTPPWFFERVQFRQLDLNDLGHNPGSLFEDGSLDVIVLEHVLYNVKDLHATLGALRRGLKDDGLLVFTMAIRTRPRSFFPCEFIQSTLRSYHKAQTDPPFRTNVGYLTWKEWDLSLDRAGFASRVYPDPELHEALPHGGVIAWPSDTV